MNRSRHRQACRYRHAGLLGQAQDRPQDRPAGGARPCGAWTAPRQRPGNGCKIRQACRYRHAGQAAGQVAGQACRYRHAGQAQVPGQEGRRPEGASRPWKLCGRRPPTLSDSRIGPAKVLRGTSPTPGRTWHGGGIVGGFGVVRRPILHLACRWWIVGWGTPAFRLTPSGRL